MKKKLVKRIASAVLTAAMVVSQIGVWNADWGTEVVKAEEVYNWESTGFIDNGNFNTPVQKGEGAGVWYDYAPEWTISLGSWDNESSCVGKWQSDERVGVLNLYNGTDSDNTATMERTVENVPAGTYRLKLEQNAEAKQTSLAINVLNSDGTTQLITKSLPQTENTTNWFSVVTDEFSLETEGNIKIQITGAVPSGYWGNFDNFVLEQKTQSTDEDISGKLITNGDFEDGLNGWTASETPKKHGTKSAEGTATDTYGKIYDFYTDTKIEYSTIQEIELTAGSYKLTAEAMGDKGIKVFVYFDGRVSTDCVNDPGWNEWTKVGENSVFNLDEDKMVKVGFYIVSDEGGWGNVDNVILEKIESTEEKGTQKVEDIPTDDKEEEEEDLSNAVSAGIKIKKISNLPEDFIKGVDVSSYISEKQSGVKYYDFTGKELDDQGFFNLLASCGVNYVRIRVWHNPYNENGKGYGGGNNDLEKAKKIGKWASDAGMQVLVDFHYSDFWTDPGKQYIPKAWKDLSVEEKASALNEYTIESLTALLDAGVNVGMVQVGNETNAKFCGETVKTDEETQETVGWDNICKLFQAGCSAVRAVEDTKFGAEVADGSKIMIALHFADPQTSGRYSGYAKQLNDYSVDYDVFASSYYPFFHGTTDNLTNVLSSIANSYGKKVVVAETSWATTLEDGDGHDNQIRIGNNDTPHYEFSVLGQATEVRTVMDAVVKVGEAGIGAFYWEPAWIPVQYTYNADGSKNQSIYNSNVQKWETYGSGWASSFGGEYQKDAADWYGGSAMDNQAMFDMYGHPLESLKVFNYVSTGTVVSDDRLEISSASVESKQITYGESIRDNLPRANVGFNNATSQQNVEVVWNEADINNVQSAGVGNYKIRGTVVVTLNGKQLSKVVQCNVTILPANFMPNYSLEDTNEWKFSDGSVVSIQADGNSRTGKNALKFYSASEFSYEASINVTIEKSGVYKFGGYIQGGEVGDNAKFTYSVKVGDSDLVTATADELKGWNSWIDTSISNLKIAEDNTTVTITVKGSDIAAGGWGSWDDFYINKTSTDEESGNGDNGSTGENNSGSNNAGGSTPSTPSPETKPDNTTETKPDGSTVENKTETKPDGTKVETTTETATDGSKKETVVETKLDGTKVETITETATDGSKVETKKESETNTAGKQVDVATVTKTDADGKVTSVAEKSTINEIAENTTATVTVKKDSEGAVTSATASVVATIEGKKTSLSADVIAQVQEASGQKDVAVTVTAKNDEGKTLYKVKVDTKNLTAENALYIYKVDSKTGELVMVNSKTYKVDENGGLDISIKNKATYELVSKEEAKAIEKQIKATIKVQNSSKDVKKGKTTKVAFDKKMNMNNVKSITYQTADKKIATVSKSGKVTAKAKGTVTVKATVTLKNGSKKTVTMKIKVK